MRPHRSLRLLTAAAALSTTAVLVPSAVITGRLTCRELVSGYLDRIAASDRRRPALQSIIGVNPTALAQADAIDAGRRPSQGSSTDALHRVPVLLKDNIDVAGLPTTAGASVLTRSMPPDDAHLTQALRAEGAVVLGKATPTCLPYDTLLYPSVISLPRVGAPARATTTGSARSAASRPCRCRRASPPPRRRASRSRSGWRRSAASSTSRRC